MIFYKDGHVFYLSFLISFRRTMISAVTKVLLFPVYAAERFASVRLPATN